MQEDLKVAQAGTLESNDVVITVAPQQKGSGFKMEVDSIVLTQYGDAIRQTITAIINANELNDVFVKVVDRGALDCTIRARMMTALERAGFVLKEEVI